MNRKSVCAVQFSGITPLISYKLSNWSVIALPTHCLLSTHVFASHNTKSSLNECVSRQLTVRSILLHSFHRQRYVIFCVINAKLVLLQTIIQHQMTMLQCLSGIVIHYRHFVYVRFLSNVYCFLPAMQHHVNNPPL